MDFLGDNRDAVTRIAICAVAAFILYTAVEKLGDGGNLPMLGPYLPWIRENKVQAIAITAAVLYGVSLAIWPEEKQVLTQTENNPYEGYEAV